VLTSNKAKGQKRNCRAVRRLLSMGDITIARAECFAKQRCGFSLFFSCSVLLSTAKSGDPRDAARADFSFASRGLRAKARPQVVAGRLFFPCYLQENTEKTAPRGSPSHVADAAVHHYLTRCRRGHGRGTISHGVVAAL
jgi:hypothetical protein